MFTLELSLQSLLFFSSVINDNLECIVIFKHPATFKVIWQLSENIGHEVYLPTFLSMYLLVLKKVRYMEATQSIQPEFVHSISEDWTMNTTQLVKLLVPVDVLHRWSVHPHVS